MSVHEYSSLNAHVKIDQPDSYLNEMLSFNQLQLKVMLGNNEEEKIKFLTNIINDQTSTKDQKTNSLQLRMEINFELKRWEDVINDINTLQQTIDSPELQVMKSKATIQECCRKERVSMINMINNGKHTDEVKAHFFNISQRCVDDFIEGQAVTKGRRSTAISNKRQKSPFKYTYSKRILYVD